MSLGVLYLIPTNLSERFFPAEVLPARVIAVATGLEYFVAENAKTARAFLKNIGITRPLQDISIKELNHHTANEALTEMLAPLLAGRDMGLVSDAGAPGVADPGAFVVALAHQHGIRVAPLVGPSAILLGLMASGLNGQRFAFHGYLPQDKNTRIKAIAELEKESAKRDMTQLFIETPYRNLALFTDLLATLDPATRLCIATDLTGADERVHTLSVRHWRKTVDATQKRPTLFLFHASPRPRGAQVPTANAV